MFGYAKAEVLGKTPAIVHRPGESSQLTAKILDGVRREGRWSGEIHYRSKAGAEGICETVVVPLWSERGRIQGTVGVNRDITERKRAEDALQTAHDELETRVQERTAALAKTNTTLQAEITAHQQAAEALSRSQQQYAALVNSVNGIVWEADMQTQRFSFVGQQAERLLGYPLERWLREPDFWAEHMHPDDREWVFAFCEKAMWEQPAFQLR